MKKLLLLIIILIAGCEGTTSIIYKKPFIIYSKSYYSTMADYYYQDANGEKANFTDLKDKYSVGDTIK